MKKLTFEEAEKLSMKTDYAVFACEPECNKINKADAAAFFLEGYEYAEKLFKKSHLAVDFNLQWEIKLFREEQPSLFNEVGERYITYNGK